MLGYSKTDTRFIVVLSFMAFTIIAAAISSELGYLEPAISKLVAFYESW